MKRTVTYPQTEGKQPLTIEYEDTAPCIVCGEPVISASMGGTVVCPWCDVGKCRYCGVIIYVVKEAIDGGESKKALLEHMKWHRERDPTFNDRMLEVHRKAEAKMRIKEE